MDADNSHSRRGAFTLIELLVVIAIIAILAVVIVLVLNPIQLIDQSRDANRVSDMSTLSSVLGLSVLENLPLGNASTVYVSIPDNSNTCADLGLPSLPSGWSYACAPSSTYTNVNGTGWIPVDFIKLSSGAPIDRLPVDPVNTTSSCLYYTYTTDGKNYEFTTGAQATKDLQNIALSSSTYSDLLTVGDNLSLEPIDYASGCSATHGGGGGDALALGETYNVSSTSGQVINLSFSGMGSQVVSVAATNQSGVYWSGYGSPFSIIDPDGVTTLASAYTGGGNYMIQNVTLPTTGNYTIQISPPSGTGNSGFVLSELATGTIAIGNSVNLSTSLLGQSTDLTFSGTANQVVSVGTTNSTGAYWSGDGSEFSIIEPDGVTTLASAYTGTGIYMIQNVTLPTTGSYTLKFVPTAALTGSSTISLSVPNTGSLSFNTPFVASAGLAGQSTDLTFSGTSGEVISLAPINQSGSYWSGYGALFTIYLPNSTTTLASAHTAAGSYMIQNVTLPQTGTYNVMIVPSDATGSSTFILSQDATGTIAFNTPYTVNTTNPGQAVELTFTGTASQVVSVAATSQNGVYWSGDGSPFSIIEPDGVTTLASAYTGTGSYSITSTTLPSTGTYTLLILPQVNDGNTGSSVFTLHS